MKPKEFRHSEFEDQEDWEEQEAEQKNEFHGDADKVNRANTSRNMLKEIQARNRKKIVSLGIGYSKDSEKRTK